MKKIYIFLPILLFFTLKNNNQIFSSFDFNTLNLTFSENTPLRNNHKINNLEDFFSTSSSSNLWVVTEETPKQKETRIQNMIQVVDDIVLGLGSENKPLPVDFNDFLKSQNFAQYHINEMNLYLSNSKQKELKYRALEYHLRGITASRNTIHTVSSSNRPQHNSKSAISNSNNNQLQRFQSSIDSSNTHSTTLPETLNQKDIDSLHKSSHHSSAALSSGSNNQSNSNNQLSHKPYQEALINKNIQKNLFPKLEAYFAQRAIEDAENAFKKRSTGRIYEIQYSKHLLNFGLTTASSDKNPVNLAPIQENINNFIRLEDYTSPVAEAFIRNNLKRHGIFTNIYHNTFKSHLRELEKIRNQQSLQNNAQQAQSSQPYQQQRENWLKSIQQS